MGYWSGSSLWNERFVNAYSMVEAGGQTEITFTPNERARLMQIDPTGDGPFIGSLRAMSEKCDILSNKDQGPHLVVLDEFVKDIEQLLALPVLNFKRDK